MTLLVRLLESLAVGLGDLVLLSLLLDGLGVRSARIRLAFTTFALLHVWAALVCGCPLAPFFLALRYDAQARWPALLERADPWVALAWASGVVVLLATWGIRKLRVRRSLATLGGFESVRAAGLRREVDRLARAMGIEAPRVLAVEDALGTPFVASIGRPVLVFPLGLLDRLENAEVRAVLAHELAHVRHRDVFGSVVLDVTCRLMFWNPAYALLVGRWKGEVERRRDEESCEVAGGGRQALASGLVKVYEACLGGATAPRFEGACAFAARLTERRLIHLAGAARPHGWGQRALAWAVLLLLFAAGSPSRAVSVAPDRGGKALRGAVPHSRLVIGMAWRAGLPG